MASGTLTNLGDTVPAIVTQPLMTVSVSGTYTGGTIAFDLGDGTAWSGSYAYPVEGAPSVQQVVLTANQARTFLMPCGQAPEMRVRAVTALGGNCAVSITGGTGGASGTAGAAGGALADRSGTVTAGGASQQLAPANSARRYLFIQNQSAGDLWVNFGVAAVAGQPSLKIPVGGSLAMEGGFVSTDAVNALGATTGQAFTAKEG